MAPTEWNQIFELFHAAREKSGGERVMLLDTACGENSLLRRAVEELLREDEAASGFLSKPLFSSLTGELLGARVVPGQRFGRYVIGTLLGRGGMGEVWSAHDTDLDRRVALKFLSPEALAVLDTQHAIREAKAASALNHPNIVTIHEVVQAESTVAIVMELVEGQSLREVCGKPLPTAEMLAIGAQIAEALAAAHTGGTIHGDIKPENISLRQDRYVKVLDFGLARKVTTETIALASSPALGTLRYMSPEQAQGKPLTAASDIFSFGLVLYELAAGRHAFAAASPVDTTEAILTKEPPSLLSVNRSVPPRLGLLIRAMLAKEPEARPSASEVARTLNELQRPGGTSANLGSVVWKWVIGAVVFLGACLAGWRWIEVRAGRETPSFRQITTLVPENRATAAAISPDGRLAAYANADGIFVRQMNDGSTRLVAGPRDFTVDQIAWFRDGVRLTVSGFSTATNIPEIWIVSLAGAAPRLLRMHAREATPSPDGTRIAFISQDWSEIWSLGANGEDPQRIVSGPGTDTFPLAFWSPDGKHVFYQRRHYSKVEHRSWGLDRYYRRSYESVSLDTRKVVASIPDLWVNSAAALPDGRVLFLRYDRPGSMSADQLWEVKTDPKTGAFRSSPRQVASPEEPNETHIYGMTATTDGKQVMVLRQSDQNSVFVGDFDASVPRIANIRRLTLDERTNYPHAWTADSRAVIFESNRSGDHSNFDLFKQDVNQRTAETIVATPVAEVLPQMAPDGRSLLYAAGTVGLASSDYKLMRIPINGGTPEEVPINGALDEFRCALWPGTRCVLRTTVPGEYYVFHELDPVRGEGRELARTRWIPGILGDWTISPDGKYVAIPNHDPRDARIRLLALEPKPNEPREQEVVLEALTDLRGLAWAADGKGWFASVDTNIGNRLLYVYQDRRFHSLGDIQGWAVPSPDGRRVAFLDRITATNAWLIDRR